MKSKQNNITQLVTLKQIRTSFFNIYHASKNDIPPGAGLIHDQTVKLLKFLIPQSSSVLDIGCGLGPLSAVLAKSGGLVSAIDTNDKIIKTAKMFTRNLKINFQKGTNEKLPFAANKFDAIFSFDVIEHVKDYSKSLLEMNRCVKQNGFIFIEMTPYYSLISGHHLYNYSLLPAQFLPKKLMKWIILRQKPFAVRSPKQAWATFTHLNRISIRDLKRTIHQNKLKILEENYIFKIPKLFYVKINWIKYFGFLQEIIPMSYQVALRKIGH